ncbi:Cloroperoxidase [Aureobasidium pullulans]|uniref:Cloroperoxidase n=1 Tax=Aureobasidium pullulans TaxID=5580 RepID=A0A4S9N172_AURPU|nr:Cloroperoxidase [Aureobasidium pullulans]THW44066.1 Cloroperoxidase [Aureobasidium pullulans]THW98820.1 Cloroperoxidase [Aureobasidium pullulans]THX06110.1 Cloroperoxidase [Aureobasidium pullulans]THX65658.1 Cloroperoxidase [Aureobasidium pullulans]
MTPLSILILGVLAEFTSAFPGMGNMRREAGVLPRRAAASAVSSANTAASTYPAWHPAQKGEGIRSPCPGLNSLANHDICPRSGKGYTIPILTDCLKRGLNVGGDFALVVGTAGIGSNPSPLTSGLYFDLDMLDRHDFLIEHDGSLSRADTTTGDNHSFNQTIWDTVLAYYSGMTDATIPVASKARFNRIQTEAARDPNFSYSPVQFILSYGETALYLSTMGDPITGVAPLEYVRSLFEEEKLPYELGWQPPKTTTTLASLGAMALQLNLASGEQVPEGVILGEKSLRAALIGLNAATGEIENNVVYAVAKLTGALGSLTGVLKGLTGS